MEENKRSRGKIKAWFDLGSWAVGSIEGGKMELPGAALVRRAVWPGLLLLLLLEGFLIFPFCLVIDDTVSWTVLCVCRSLFFNLFFFFLFCFLFLCV
jgi:hypothetical protein